MNGIRRPKKTHRKQRRHEKSSQNRARMRPTEPHDLPTKGYGRRNERPVKTREEKETEQPAKMS